MNRLGFVALLAFGAAYLAAYGLGVRPPEVFMPFMVVALTLIAAVFVIGLIGYIGWLALWEREPHPTPRVIAVLRRFASPRIIWERLGPLIIAYVFLGAFGTFKALIPKMHPFALDTFLSDADRWMLGTDAWRITHAVIGPVGTQFIELTYGLWFVAWMIAIMYFSMVADKAAQQRFFLSFFMVWGVIGIVMATILSSAGPCFLELIGHPYANRYHIPLADAPNAVRAQKFLAESYTSGSVGLAHGISAMPSVHVAVATIMALAAGVRMRIVAWVYWAIILVGSVHLGWHYFSDGLVGTLAAIAIWRFSGARGTQLPARNLGQWLHGSGALNVCNRR